MVIPTLCCMGSSQNFLRDSCCLTCALVTSLSLNPFIKWFKKKKNIPYRGKIRSSKFKLVTSISMISLSMIFYQVVYVIWSDTDPWAISSYILINFHMHKYGQESFWYYCTESLFFFYFWWNILYKHLLVLCYSSLRLKPHFTNSILHITYSCQLYSISL